MENFPSELIIRSEWIQVVHVLDGSGRDALLASLPLGLWRSIAGLLLSVGSQLNPSLGITLSWREPPHPRWCLFLGYNPHCMIGQCGVIELSPMTRVVQLRRTIPALETCGISWVLCFYCNTVQSLSVPFQFPLLFHNYWLWGHFPRNFLHGNIHLRVHFPGKTREVILFLILVGQQRWGNPIPSHYVETYNCISMYNLDVWFYLGGGCSRHFTCLILFNSFNNLGR